MSKFGSVFLLKVVEQRNLQAELLAESVWNLSTFSLLGVQCVTKGLSKFGSLQWCTFFPSPTKSALNRYNALNRFDYKTKSKPFVTKGALESLSFYEGAPILFFCYKRFGLRFGQAWYLERCAPFVTKGLNFVFWQSLTLKNCAPFVTKGLDFVFDKAWHKKGAPFVTRG